MLFTLPPFLEEEKFLLTPAEPDLLCVPPPNVFFIINPDLGAAGLGAAFLEDLPLDLLIV